MIEQGLHVGFISGFHSMGGGGGGANAKYQRGVRRKYRLCD